MIVELEIICWKGIDSGMGSRMAGMGGDVKEGDDSNDGCGAG